MAMAQLQRPQPQKAQEMHPEAWTRGPAHSGQTRNDEVETAAESVVRGVLPGRPGNMAALTFGSSAEHTEQNPKVKAP